MAAVVLGAQQSGREAGRGYVAEWRVCLGLGLRMGSGTQLKWRNAIYFRIDNRLILLVRVFQLLILRCGPRVALQRGWWWQGGEVDCLADWMLVALVAFIELAISLPFELLLSLVVAYLLAAFGRILCFTLPPSPSFHTAFRFLFGRFQHMPAPLWCPLKRTPSEQLLLLLAACCLLSAFCFLFSFSCSLVKWFPHIIAFVVRPTLALWHASSPCTPISASSSRSCRAPNPSYVEIIRQDLCEWATVFAICLQRRRRHQTRTTRTARTARTARRWQ